MKSSKQKRAKVAISALTASLLAGAFSATTMAQNTPVSNFDTGYLDEHPVVAQQLSAHPELVDNPAYMARHPQLQQFLVTHPNVRTELKQHPFTFMNRENQFNGSNGDNPPAGPAARFDTGYLAQHPDVAHQLAANPALVDNPQFIASHPELHQYLATHPQVRADLQTHPYRFMGREDQLNGWHGPSNSNGPHPLRTTDNFLSSHPGVEQQLNNNPKLIDNPGYLAHHPGLHGYLQSHPFAKHAWQSHPYRYMRLENRYQQKH